MNKNQKMPNGKNEIEASTSMDASTLAWEMFKKSGNINYYRLYSDLKKKDDQWYIVTHSTLNVFNLKGQGT